MLCLCNRCKYQVPRLRRICDDHSQKWGIFPREVLECVLGSSSIDPAINPLDIQPQRDARPSVPLTSQVHEQQVKENLETFYEQSMDDMLDAIHDTDVHNDREDSARRAENVSNEQKEMRRLAHFTIIQWSQGVRFTCKSLHFKLAINIWMVRYKYFKTLGVCIAKFIICLYLYETII